MGDASELEKEFAETKVKLAAVEAELEDVKLALEDPDNAKGYLKGLSRDQLLEEKKQLREKEKQLLREKEILLLKRQEPPGAVSGAPGPAAVEALLPLDRFKSFLARSGIQHPDEKAIGNCIRYLPSRLSVVSDIDMAVELYREAGRIPCTTTRAAVRDDSNITVNGPLSEACPMVLSGATSTGRPLVIKIVDSAEEDTCCDLKLSDFFDSPESCNNLVPCTVVKLDHSAVEDVRIFKRSPPLTFRALVMPRYVCNLAELPQLDVDCIVKGGHAMLEALDYIHKFSRVHMDVKAANVFIDGQGGWQLGDFGSCVRIGYPITSYSNMFHPEKLNIANVSYDFDFLVVMLVIETLKAGDKWKDALFESRCISAAKIFLWSSPEKVRNEGLSKLFGDLWPRMSMSSPLSGHKTLL